MKKMTFAFLFVFIAAAMLVVPAMALGSAQAEGSASDVQLYVIGLVSTAIIYALKLVSDRFPNVTLTREGIAVGIYVIALGLSFAFGGFALPAFAEFSDPLTFVSALFGFINTLLMVLAAPVSLATLFSNLIGKRVFDAGAIKAGLKG
jgi:hypothetical protein